jgi:hypothetical protein
VKEYRSGGRAALQGRVETSEHNRRFSAGFERRPSVNPEQRDIPHLAELRQSGLRDSQLRDAAWRISLAGASLEAAACFYNCVAQSLP